MKYERRTKSLFSKSDKRLLDNFGSRGMPRAMFSRPRRAKNMAQAFSIFL